MDDWDPTDDEDGGLVTALTVFAVLGAGFLAMFAGLGWFWMIWVFGFAVVLPVVAILEDRLGRPLGDRERYEPDHHRDRRKSRREEEEDALETLKRRYAEGEIDEVEFERRLERLVENESIEDVEERIERDPEIRDRGDRNRERDRDRDRQRDREFDLE